VPAGPERYGPGAPSILDRSQWAWETWDYSNPDCENGPRVAEHLSAVVVHHTLMTNDYSENDVDDMLRAIYYQHVVLNGWCDIAYNFIVDRFGRIWETRTDSIAHPVIGGHARGFNNNTVGIGMLGQFHKGALRGRPARLHLVTKPFES